MASRKSKSEMEREKVIQNRLQELLTRMLQDEDNKYCVDCDAKGPRWVSWNIGIFVCIRCAGIHRNLGVHISKVKSVNLDSWTPQQVASVQIMGNSKARAVYEANVPEGFRRPQNDAQLDTFIRAKYEKKKYIAREYVPQKAPEFPDGWTALIEAEKQKKDIRTIVLPSHTSNAATPSSPSSSSKSDEAAKRERQSPKEVAKATSDTEKTLQSNFDLLSLNQTQQSSTTAPDVAKTRPKVTTANDLLCLGDENNSAEFDDFIGAQTQQKTTPSVTTSTSSQNGTPKTNSSSSANFFDDFSITAPAANEEAKQTMSKDSIMALFNKQPPPTHAAPQNTNLFPNTQNFMPAAGGLGFGAPVSAGGGMQIPANFGIGNPVAAGNNAGFNQFQVQQPPVAPGGFGGMGNNPFLAMSQTNNSQNSVFGNSNTNFLQ